MKMFEPLKVLFLCCVLVVRNFAQDILPWPWLAGVKCNQENI